MIKANKIKNILENERKYGDETVSERVCGLIEFKEKVEDSITHQKYYTLMYRDDLNKCEYEFKGDYSDFSLKKIENFLCENGIEVMNNDLKDLSYYLQVEACKLKNTSKLVKRVGFNDDKSEFYTNNCIKKDSVEPIKQGMQHSTSLETKGSIDKYNEMLSCYVTNTEMKLALTLGFTAPMVAYLDDKLDLGVILVGMHGGSSTGKTTASQLMISTFANPKLGTNYGFSVKAKSTKLNFNAILENVWGVPILIDDISALYSGNLQDLIYDLESGTMKGRSNLDYTSSATYNWKGLITLTSEKSYLNSAMLGGAFARLLDFDNVKWTTSAEQSEAIKAIIAENYGFYGEKFVKDCIFSRSVDEHLENINLMINTFKFKLSYDKYDEITERVIKKYATIIYTSALLNEFFKGIVDINPNDIMDKLVRMERKSYDIRRLSDSSYLNFCEFIKKNNYIFNNDKKYGEIVTSDTMKTVFLTKEGFEFFLTEYNYQDKENKILSGWQRDGHMVRDTDNAHILVRRTIDKRVVRCYKIFIKD